MIHLYARAFASEIRKKGRHLAITKEGGVLMKRPAFHVERRGAWSINVRLLIQTPHVDRLLALTPGGYFEFHSLSVLEGLEPLSLDRAVMHE